MNVSGVTTEFGNFPNVIHEVHGHDWSCILEAHYLREFLANIRGVDPVMFHSHRFLIMNRNSRWEKILPPFHGKDVVLIWLGDEDATIPLDLAPKFRLILKSYWPLRESVGNIHPFPLCGRSDVLKVVPKAFADREISVFFSGNLNANRIDLYRQFTPWRSVLPFNTPTYPLRRMIHAMQKGLFPAMRRDFSGYYPGSVIQFTQGFQQGYPPDEFAGKLANSCIAICPPGFTSNESIRHFEAMRQGCVIVSAVLPPNRFYERSPIIQLSNWNELHAMVKKLIDNPLGIEELSRKTSMWWESQCSPKALAKKITNLLASLNY
jgi:hypothetical protein